MKTLLLKHAASNTKLAIAKKTVSVAIAFLLFNQSAMAQWADTLKNKQHSVTYDLYMHKRKVNNTAGAILLGSGIAMMFAGFARVASGSRGSFVGELYIPTDGIVLFAAGTGASLASIPFFISAGNNKRKARLSLKAANTAFAGIGTDNFNYMAVSLKVHF